MWLPLETRAVAAYTGTGRGNPADAVYRERELWE